MQEKKNCIEKQKKCEFLLTELIRLYILLIIETVTTKRNQILFVELIMEKHCDGLYKCMSSERYTPYSLARKIKATAILESASFAKGRERFSILMTEEAFKIVQDDNGIAFIIDGP